MTKAKVAVVVDSTANLSPELVAQYNIRVIPLHIHWGNDNLRDGIDITPDAFYKRLASSETIPTTSQPSVGEFVEFFGAVAEEAESIVGVFISDKLSGTLASARAACDMLADTPIELVDSQSASMGAGLIAIATARYAAEGHSAAEVAAYARGLVPRMRILFVVDTLEFLHRGGRIGGAQRLFGSMLSIKPLLHLEEGEVRPLARVRTMKKAVNRLLDIASEDVGGQPDQTVAVLHAATLAEAERIKADLGTRLGDSVELMQAEITPVVGTHTGPGAVGVAYILGE